MVVLHVSKSRVYSGMENVALSIITSMPEDIRGVFLTPTGSIETKLLEANVEYIGVDKVDEKAIKKAIEEVKPDIIQAYEYDCSLMCARVTDTIPIISQLYSSPKWVQKIGPKSITYGSFCKNFTKIIAPVESIVKKAWFRDKIKDKAEILGIPFDAKKIFEKGYIAGTEMSSDKLQNYKSDLLFVGHLTEDKNPYEFIRIVDEIKKTHFDVSAVMVGGGDLGSECLELINRLGLQNNVRMVGMQYNPYIYMNQTKILVIPSTFEGFGMATLEAMTFGKPVFASCVGGLVLTVDDEVGKICGTPKKPVDREAFVSGITTLLDNQGLYQKKSEAARKRAKDMNTSQRYMKDMQRIYEDIYQTTK
ncbi:MAG: glycosyltransferase [Pseudobutyrivibrio sp.]|nr:glycosyltransferase [Pseudobutyrivibrio sp.]